MMISRATTCLLLAATVSAAPLTPKEHVQPLVASTEVGDLQLPKCQEFPGQQCDGGFKCICHDGQFCDPTSSTCQYKPTPTPTPPTPAPDPIPDPTPTPSGGWTILNPNPKILEWKAELPESPSSWSPESPSSKKILSGYLTVPLSHDTDDPAHAIKLKLRVSAMLTGQEGSSESLLFHCGGPGSTDTCAMSFGEGGYVAQGVAAGGFHLLGIAQRGSAYDSDFPSRSASVPILGKVIQDFDQGVCKGKRHDDKLNDPSINWATISQIEALKLYSDCACDFPEDTHLEPPGGASDFEDPIKGLAKVRWIASRDRACYNDPYWQLTSEDGSVSANFLNYVGTNELAHDLELFREAIGSSKLGCFGGSYGTSVCSTYAGVYPDKVGRLILDGNVYDPTDGTSALVWDTAHGYEQALWKILQLCNAESCVGEEGVAPSDAYRMVMKSIEENPEKYSVATSMGSQPTKAHLSADMFASRMITTLRSARRRLSDVKYWVDALSEFYRNLDEKEMSYGVKRVVESLTYGYPDAKLSVILNLENRWGGVNGPIMALDFADRYTNDGALEMIQTAFRRYTRPAALAASELGVVLTFPAEPTPAVYGNRPNVKGVTVGNLYDAATPFKATMKMHAGMPSTSLMTWQGIGHCTGPNDYDPEGIKLITDKLVTYLKNGTMPPNGFTARSSKGFTAKQEQYRSTHEAKMRAMKTKKLKK